MQICPFSFFILKSLSVTRKGKLRVVKLTYVFDVLFVLFIYYLAAPQPFFGYCQGVSLIQLIIISLFNFQLKDLWEACNQFGSLSLTEYPVGYEHSKTEATP